MSEPLHSNWYTGTLSGPSSGKIDTFRGRGQ